MKSHAIKTVENPTKSLTRTMLDKHVPAAVKAATTAANRGETKRA